MPKYRKIVDVWDPTVDLKSLQVGQCVEAGKDGDRGMWCGLKASGAAVVMFFNNARNRNPKEYRRLMLQYGRTWNGQ